MRRKKTDREDAMHDQIQSAMNWDPRHAVLCDDGKYRNAYGVEYTVRSLEELIMYIDNSNEGK